MAAGLQRQRDAVRRYSANVILMLILPQTGTLKDVSLKPLALVSPDKGRDQRLNLIASMHRHDVGAVSAASTTHGAGMVTASAANRMYAGSSPARESRLQDRSADGFSALTGERQSWQQT